MTRPLSHLTYNKVALLLLFCAIVLGGAVLFTRSHLYSEPHAAEMAGIGHVRDLPPLW